MVQVGASKVKTMTYGLQGNGSDNDEQEHAMYMNCMIMMIGFV
jgi:hypothetical protein